MAGESGNWPTRQLAASRLRNKRVYADLRWILANSGSRLTTLIIQPAGRTIGAAALPTPVGSHHDSRGVVR
jgi:hypothetical protein